MLTGNPFKSNEDPLKTGIIPPMIIVLGATASGKTRLAVSLAGALGGEIISADSRQVFRGMDIGTGKDLSEYVSNGRPVSYHLIDIREPGERYHVDAYKEDFYRVYADLNARGVLPVLCGGTGMYVHSILQNHDLTGIPVNQSLRELLLPMDTAALRRRLSAYPPELTAHADLSSHKRLVRAIEIAHFRSEHPWVRNERPALRPFVIGLSTGVPSRRARILQRLSARLEQGMIGEVQALLFRGVSRAQLEFYGLEYKFVTAYLFNELSYDRLVERLGTAICQFAKRQMTFFRKMEKDGVWINWFDAEKDSDELSEEILMAYDTWLSEL